MAEKNQNLQFHFSGRVTSYPERIQPRTHPRNISIKSYLILSSHVRLCFSSYIYIHEIFQNFMQTRFLFFFIRIRHIPHLSHSLRYNCSVRNRQMSSRSNRNFGNRIKQSRKLGIWDKICAHYLLLMKHQDIPFSFSRFLHRQKLRRNLVNFVKKSCLIRKQGQ